MALALVPLSCPTCGASCGKFYGPCASCREGLRQRARSAGAKTKGTFEAVMAKKEADNLAEIARLEEQARNRPPMPWEKKRR